MSEVLYFFIIASLIILIRATWRCINVERECFIKEKAFDDSLIANKELMKSFNGKFATVKYKRDNLTFAIHGVLHSKTELYYLENVKGSCPSMLYFEFKVGCFEKINQYSENGVVEIILR